MSVPRGKKVAVIAGLAVVAVAMATGIYWRGIYYSIYPEARFWGRWKVVGPLGNGPSGIAVEFFENGRLVFEPNPRAFATIPMSILLAGDYDESIPWFTPLRHAQALKAFDVKPRYEIRRDRISISTLQPRKNFEPIKEVFDSRHRSPNWPKIPTDQRRSLNSQYPWGSIDAPYRFESVDLLVVEGDDTILGYLKTLTLRRLPEHGDADE